MLVVPATVAGVSGDFILDTGTDRTALHDTRARGAGFEGEQALGDVVLAGRRFPARTVAVAKLDARTWAFPTPIAGVIGRDVLATLVLEVESAPCRVRLDPAGPAPRGETLAMTPGVRTGVSDGPRAQVLSLTPATGLDAPLRLSPRLAAAPGAEPERLAPYEPGRASLRALSLGGALFENLPAGLGADEDASDGAVGMAILGAWRLRFDFPAGRLTLSPNAKDPPDRSDGS